MEILQGTHNLVEGRKGPFCSVDLFDFVWRDQACDLALINHDKTTPPRAKQFVIHEVLDVQPAIHRRAISRHNVRDPHILECVRESD